MKLTKSFAGVAVLLALFIGSPQVLAEDVEIFDKDLEETDSKLEPFKDEKNSEVETPDKLEDSEVKQSDSEKDSKVDTHKDKNTSKTKKNDEEDIPKIENFDEDNEDLGANLVFNNPVDEDENNPSDDENKKLDKEKTATSSENNSEVEIPELIQPPITENNNFDDESENPKLDDKSKVLVIDTPSVRSTEDRILPPSRVNKIIQNREKQKKMKTQKPRFVKLTFDDNYIYYLDKQSVQWKRIPYSTSEYMLDIWVRMIERNSNTANLTNDMLSYIEDTNNGELQIAAENGILYAPIDIEVMQHKKFFLEHYYIRPKTKQIQFLCELEVVGHPQNTISEREYDYRNWENLIPGSIESIIYHKAIKEVDKSGSSDKRRMTFTDMLEEYGRISIR